MEWFVQTPEYSFKNTLRHSILVDVFSLESCRSEYIPFHAEWCASGACCFKLTESHFWVIKNTLSPIDPESFSSTPPKREQAYNVLLKQEEKLLQNDGTTGTLIVPATREHRGKRIYILPRHIWHQASSMSVRDDSTEKKYAVVTLRHKNNYPIYVAVFRNLRQGKYIVWTTYGKENPKNDAVEVIPDDISEFELT